MIPLYYIAKACLCSVSTMHLSGKTFLGLSR